MDTSNTLHDYSLYWLGTDTNKKWWDKTSSMGQQFFSSLTQSDLNKSTVVSNFLK